ncbi:MAG: hypothetical protein F7B17_05820, partial [Desulfurococcales archaeon]|nr:hypothetical protein [Desulfurococcales archaeon]
MNPRRPTPSGPKPDPSSGSGVDGGPRGNNQSQGVLKQRLGIQVSQRLLSEFLEWCKGHSSEETCAQYSRKLLEIDRGERDVSSSRWHVTAYKRFMKFLCESKGVKRACEEYRSVKSRRSSPDLYVPSESEILEALRSPVGWFYQALLESGLRAVEAARVLSESSSLRWVERDGFA